MKRKQPSSTKLLNAGLRFVVPMVALTVTLGVLRFVFPASSAPVTGSATAKLTVYSGVATIVPGGAGDSLMELGNAGRDIASTGSIFIRPDSLSTGTANFAQFSKDGNDRASLRIPGSLVAGPVTRHSIGTLSASAAQAKRYEVARIGYDQINWSNNSSVFVELHQKLWDAGGYKKYEVRAGYTDDGSYRLVDATGLSSTMTEVRLQIGPRVVVTGPNVFYLPVYVDVDYYTTWDVVITHNMTEVSGVLPSTSQLRIFENGTAGNAWDQNIVSFAENDTVIHNFTNKFTGQNGTSEGGEIQLEGAPTAAPSWNFDVYDSDAIAGGSGATDQQFRIYANGLIRLAITQSNGNVYLPNGQLCFGNPGSTNCSNTWTGLGAISLHDVLGPVNGATNTSDRSASLGSFTAPAAKLLVNNGTTGTGSSGDAIAAYANTSNGVAVYGRQESAGAGSYAGYFSAPNVTGSAAAVYSIGGRADNPGLPGDDGNSAGVGLIASHSYYEAGGISWARAAIIQGDVEVYQGGLTPNTGSPVTSNWGLVGDVLKVQANVSAASGGFPLDVVNIYGGGVDYYGYAAKFGGAVLMEGAPNCPDGCANADATLRVNNTFSDNFSVPAGVSSSGIIATAGVGGIGFDGYANASAGSIGLKAFGDPAGYFIGTTLFEGSVKEREFVGAPTNEVVSWIQLQPGDTRNCYQACGGYANVDPLYETGQCLGSLYANAGFGSLPTDPGYCFTRPPASGTTVVRCLCR